MNSLNSKERKTFVVNLCTNHTQKELLNQIFKITFPKKIEPRLIWLNYSEIQLKLLLDKFK